MFPGRLTELSAQPHATVSGRPRSSTKVWDWVHRVFYNLQGNQVPLQALRDLEGSARNEANVEQPRAAARPRGGSPASENATCQYQLEHDVNILEGRSKTVHPNLY
jgi:hypothetical protein